MAAVSKRRIKQIVKNALSDSVKITEEEFFAQHDKMVATITAIFPKWKAADTLLGKFEDVLIDLEATPEFDKLLDDSEKVLQDRIKEMNQLFTDFTNKFHDCTAYMSIKRNDDED